MVSLSVFFVVFFTIPSLPVEIPLQCSPHPLVETSVKMVIRGSYYWIFLLLDSLMFSIHQRSSFLAKFPIITTPGNFPDCSDLIFATVGGKKLNFPWKYSLDCWWECRIDLSDLWKTPNFATKKINVSFVVIISCKVLTISNTSSR